MATPMALQGVIYHIACADRQDAMKQTMQKVLEKRGSPRVQGKTILLTSHYAQDIDTLCDTISRMEAGRLYRQ